VNCEIARVSGPWMTTKYQDYISTWSTITRVWHDPWHWQVSVLEMSTKSHEIQGFLYFFLNSVSSTA